MKPHEAIDLGVAMLGEPIGRIPRAPQPERGLFASEVVDGANPREPVGRVLARMKAEERTSMPLVDREGRLLGVVTLDDINRWMRDVIQGKQVGARRTVAAADTPASRTPAPVSVDLPAKYRLTGRD